MEAAPENLLIQGDNLSVLREHIAAESVDLVYLDPPFKSNQDYNVLFKERSGARAASQKKAFEDTWSWDDAAAAAYRDAIQGGSQIANTMRALRTLLGPSDMLAYLSMMAPRLLELRRVLRPTGSIYLHCDPAASHYLKLLLDAVFGPRNFRNEIIWKRTTAHSSAKRFGPVHDVLLYYAHSPQTMWYAQVGPHSEHYLATKYRYEDERGRYRLSDLTGAGVRRGASGETWRGFDVTSRGRHWMHTPAELDELDGAGVIYWPPKGGFPAYKRYLEKGAGRPLQDVWDDIAPINSQAKERLGYPTQKPEALLERVLRASSAEGDTVLDPFCGCGTTIAVAERLKRRWIGIDITWIALDVIEERLTRDFHGQASYTSIHEPASTEDALELARRDKDKFEDWAVRKLGGASSGKTGDRGIDGRAFFHETALGDAREIVISVKGGHTGPEHVRELRGVVEREHAAVGVLVTAREPTRAMRREAATAGFYESATGSKHARVQLLTPTDLFAGRDVDLPPAGTTAVDRRQHEQLVLRPQPAGTPLPATAPGREPRTTVELVEELLSATGVSRPPVRLEPILERLNIEARADPKMREDAHVVPMTNPAAGAPAAWMAYYNPSRPEARRRFTLAHEVGHVVLHGAARGAAAAARGGAGKGRREREVNRFASELLMPRQLVRDAVREFGVDVDYLRSLFLVSRPAMEARLRELGLG